MSGWPRSDERALPPGLTVVVPVYNSAASLPELFRALDDVLGARRTPFEVVFVNDGSRDDSWETLLKLRATYPWARCVNLMRNYGQHNALLCGIRAARYDVIVTMDDDLQHPPEEIATLVGLIEQGWDVVYGTPAHEQHGVLRDLASQITKIVLQNAMGAAIARKVSAFRAFRTQLRDGFADYHGPYVSIDVLLTWSTTRFTAVTVRHEPRRIGASNYTVMRLVVHALNMMTGFSTAPLQLASWIGFLCTAFGFGVLVWVIGRYLVLGYSVPGFPFLASVIAIFSGAQLFSLGIIGEYLARMHFRLMDRPPYVVRDSRASE